jgi:rod shape-determining protein MreD
VTARAYFRTVLVIVVTLLIQSTVVLDIRIAGAHPDLMLLLPVAAGLAGDPDQGAIVGFLAGLAADVVLPTPFGLTALVGCIEGFVVGYSVRSASRPGWWFTSAVALIASAGSVMLYAVLGAILGQEQFLRVDLVAIVCVVAVVNALLAVPALRVMRWALAPSPDSAQGAWTSRAGAAGSRW